MPKKIDNKIDNIIKCTNAGHQGHGGERNRSDAGNFAVLPTRRCVGHA